MEQYFCGLFDLTYAKVVVYVKKFVKKVAQIRYESKQKQYQSC